MDSPDEYRSVGGESEGLYKESGSRFIAFVYPVCTAEEVRAHIDALKKEYHDARHCCYAYRIGPSGEQWRANDDGEPSGSAGRPILGQIDSLGLSDVLVAVVRYFGGIKLGIPGLVNAYRTSSRDALDKAAIVTKFAYEKLAVTFPWEQTDRVLKALRETEARVDERAFDTECTFRVSVRLSRKQSLAAALGDIDNVRIEYYGQTSA